MMLYMLEYGDGRLFIGSKQFSYCFLIFSERKLSDLLTINKCTGSN